jgi:hypothetical protein
MAIATIVYCRDGDSRVWQIAASWLGID